MTIAVTVMLQVTSIWLCNDAVVGSSAQLNFAERGVALPHAITTPIRAELVLDLGVVDGEHPGEPDRHPRTRNRTRKPGETMRAGIRDMGRAAAFSTRIGAIAARARNERSGDRLRDVLPWLSGGSPVSSGSMMTSRTTL